MAQITNCRQCGKSTTAGIWCSDCQTRFPVQYDVAANGQAEAVSDPVERARRDYAIAVALQDAFKEE